MTVEQLCHAIGLPEEVIRTVLETHRTLDVPQRVLLRKKETWEEGLKEVQKALGEDPRGFKMLTLMLHTAIECREDYDARGISEEVYIASMSCFTRFVKEHMVSYGCYGFDRGFWTVRQLSLTVFRLGQLEYEIMDDARRGKFISIHIPNSSRLEPKELRLSYETARAFFAEFFPDYADVPYGCHSWLLSPDLKEILPQTSRIRYFQDQFIILGSEPSDDYLEWAFQRSPAATENLPERTSLQRSLKAFLLRGGVFRNGEGILRPDPFRE